MTYTMKYINKQWPEHTYNSCTEESRANAGYNLCPRCTALELRSLELRRKGLTEMHVDEEE